MPVKNTESSKIHMSDHVWHEVAASIPKHLSFMLIKYPHESHPTERRKKQKTYPDAPRPPIPLPDLRAGTARRTAELLLVPVLWLMYACVSILWMEEILHHQSWNPISSGIKHLSTGATWRNWCRISSIHRMFGEMLRKVLGKYWELLHIVGYPI